MESPPIPPASQPSPEGRYGYGGYGSYGGSGFGEPSVRRSFRDYLLILRERKWYIISVFFVIFSSSLVYTLTQTKIYQATASVQILRRDPTVMQVQAVVDNDVRTMEDLNTVVKVLESESIVQKVAERLSGEDLRLFMQPYEKGDGQDPLTPAQVLVRNRKVLQQRGSLVIWVQYRHPDRLITAKIANLFVDEFITRNARVRIDESMKAVDELKVRAEQQRKKVEELAITLQGYREKHNMVSLDQRKDIVTEKLKALNLLVTQSDARLKDAEIRWKQIKEHRASGAPLTDLSFIATQSSIALLSQQLAAQNIMIAQMRERYRSKHPKMVEAVNSLTQIDHELKSAIDGTASSVEGEYQSASRSYEEARKALGAQEGESLGLDRAAVEYDAQERELRINEQLLQHLIGRMRETAMTSTIESQNARVVDRARPSEPEDYVKPSKLLNLAIGGVGGLGLGLLLAFFMAFIDDRVKTAFDIESVIGLPLIGVIPQIRKRSLVEKAQIAGTHADQQVAESFLTLHSALRLKEASKNAQCILVTSTIPGEGKSFTVTNLALTFAAHGERVVIVDCDLRKPNIHRSFEIENTKGVIDLCSGGAGIEEVVVRDLYPNFHIIPTGGRAKNPTQILNSDGFAFMIAQLRERYDRIFIDTPPLAAVSDALIILPMVDGSIFTIYFNKVRRKAAQFSAKRLLETQVPNFGAVLNGLNLAMAGYYHAQYYDKAYKDYYVTTNDDDEPPPR